MHARPGSNVATAAARTAWPVDPFIPARLRPPTGRSRFGHIFAEAIVACMVEARRPDRQEIQAVAARIWAEVQTGRPRIGWCDLVPGCRPHRLMIAAARAALGEDRPSGVA